MAKRVDPPGPAKFTADGLRKAIPRLRQRIEELESFDCSSLEGIVDAQVSALIGKVNSTLADVFGKGTQEYWEYHCDRLLPGSSGGDWDEMSKGELQQAYERGMSDKAVLLKSLSERLDEILEDLGGQTAQGRGPGTTTPAAMETRTRTVLFMDVAGWSKLKPHEIHAYVTAALPRLAEILRGNDFINTWGDAIVATFESARTAAEKALAVRDFFVHSYPEDGVAAGLTCRISLHLGEVIWCENPLRAKPDIFGHAVHVAARLEPVTALGHVYCTHAVAEALEGVAGSAPRAWPIGPVALPKGSGTIEAYAVTGPNAPDPRPIAVQRSRGPNEEPEAAPPVLTDDEAAVRLKGWVNKLAVQRSGEAIALKEIEVTCGVGHGQPFRLLGAVVAGCRGRWSVEELTERDVILRLQYRRRVVGRMR